MKKSKTVKALAFFLAVIMAFSTVPFVAVGASKNPNKPCSDCSGKGTVSIECLLCQGTGEVQCEKCSGTGEFENEGVLEPCDVCNGTGKVECTACEGKGEVEETCSTCSGSGFINEAYEISFTTSDGVEYTSDLAEALKNVKNDGTIRLLDDVNLESNVSFSGQAALDLNGFSLTNTVEDSEFTISLEKPIEDYIPRLTVEDSSADKNGKIADSVITYDEAEFAKSSVSSDGSYFYTEINSVDPELEFDIANPEDIKYNEKFKNVAVSKAGSNGKVTYSIDSETNTANGDEGVLSVAGDGTVTAIGVGTSKVQATIAADGVYKSAVATYDINVKKADFSVSVESYKGTYDKKYHNVVVVNDKIDGDVVKYVVNDRVYEECPQIKDVGSIAGKVVVQRGTYYNDAEAEFSASVTQATFDLITVKVNTDIVYNGEPQEVIESITDSKEDPDAPDVIYYQQLTDAFDEPEDSAYTQEVPKVTNAGTYYFAVKVTRGGNYKDYVEFPIVVSVAKAESKVSVTNSQTNITYGETLNIETSYISDSDAKLSYEVIDGSNVVEVDASGKITTLMSGKATVRVTLGETENYKSSYTDYTITVDKADLQASFFMKGEGDENLLQITYGDNNYFGTGKSFKNEIVGLPENYEGEISYNSDSSFFSIDENGNVVFDDYTAGFESKTANVSVSISSDDRYNATTMSYKINVVPAEVDENMYVMPKANENGWYNSAVDIVASDGYQICASSSFNAQWQDKLTFASNHNGNETFYIRNTKTGYITSAITEMVKIDLVKPEGLTIEFVEPVVSKIIDAVTFGYYNSENNKPVKIKITATDDYSGLKSFTYNVNGINETYIFDGEIEKGQREYVLPDTISSDNFTSEVVFTANDCAGNSQTYGLNEGEKHVVVNDTTAPKVSISYDNNSSSNDIYFGNKRTATVSVVEDNFDPSTISVNFSARKSQYILINVDVPELKDEIDGMKDIANWTKSDTQENLYTYQLTFEKDAYYTFEITGISDISGNEIDKNDVTYAEGTVAGKNFYIDSTKPGNLSIEYRNPVFTDIWDNITFNFFKDAEKNNSGIILHASDDNGITKFEYTIGGDKRTYNVSDPEPGETTYEIPGLFSSDFDYEIYFVAYDTSGNKAQYGIADDKQNIVNDNTQAVFSEEIDYKNQVATTTEKDGTVVHYYNDGIAEIGFTVKESALKYFDNKKDMVSFDAVKDGEKYSITDFTVEKKQSEEDTYLIIANIDTENNDGEFVVTLTVTDPSGNENSITTEKIIIDTKNPEIVIDYDNNDYTNSKITSDEKEIPYYFGKERTATITVEEKNFDPSTIKFEMTAVDINGTPVNSDPNLEAELKNINDIDNWNQDAENNDIYTYILDFAASAHYKFSIASMQDIAKNNSNINYAEGTKAPNEFCVDVDDPIITAVKSTPIVEKILSLITFGIYKEKAEITVSVTDNISGISSVNISSDDNTDLSSKDVISITKNDDKDNGAKTVADVFDEPQEKTVTYVITVSPQYRGVISWSTADFAKNVSEGSKAIIVDNKENENDIAAPKISIKDEPASNSEKVEIGSNKDTSVYNGPFYFDVTIQDINSGLDDVVVSVNNSVIDNEDIIVIETGETLKELIEKAKKNIFNSAYSFQLYCTPDSFDGQAVPPSQNGQYKLTVELKDSASNVSKKTSNLSIIDVYAPQITNFEFSQSGYQGDNFGSVEDTPHENDGNQYVYYFNKDTDVIVTAEDVKSDTCSVDTAYSSGLNSIHLIAVDSASKNVVVDKIAYIDEAHKSKASATFKIPAEFKGYIYAIATDNAGNTPTSDDATIDGKGLVTASYAALFADVQNYDGYVSPFDAILETSAQHSKTSSIEIVPKEAAKNTENYKYQYTYSGDKNATKDAKAAYSDSKNVPLYSENIGFTLTVKDNYSGIRKVKWSVVGKENTENNQSGSVTVKNDGSVSDASWKATGEEGSNLVVELSKNITVKNNSNDIVILVELTDRSGNTSYDYYVLGIDKTDPKVSIQFSGNDSVKSNMYFNSSRTVTVTVTERNFDPSTLNFELHRDGVATADLNRLKKDSAWKLADSNQKFNRTSQKDVANDTKYVATFTLKTDGYYTFAFNSLSDKADNIVKKATCSGNQGNWAKFVIDKVKPTATLRDTGYDTPQNGIYYKENRVLTLVVKDRNIDTSSNNGISITHTDNTGSIVSTDSQKSLSLADRTNSRTYTMVTTYGKDSENCVYRVTRISDLAGNEISVLPTTTNADGKTFVIDKTAPSASAITATIKTLQSDRSDTIKSTPSTAEDQIALTVKCTDANLTHVESKITYTGYLYSSDSLGKKTKTVTLNAKKSLNSDGLDTASYVLNNIKDDGYYIARLQFTDDAGNKSPVVTSHFAITRNGSVIDLTGLKAVNGKTINSNDLQKQTLSFSEYNAAEVKNSEATIYFVRDNGPKEYLDINSDYTRVLANDEHGYQYNYVINSNVFRYEMNSKNDFVDGKYEFYLVTKDEDNQNTQTKKIFTVTMDAYGPNIELAKDSQSIVNENGSNFIVGNEVTYTFSVEGHYLPESYNTDSVKCYLIKHGTDPQEAINANEFILLDTVKSNGNGTYTVTISSKDVNGSFFLNYDLVVCAENTVGVQSLPIVVEKLSIVPVAYIILLCAICVAVIAIIVVIIIRKKKADSSKAGE